MSFEDAVKFSALAMGIVLFSGVMFTVAMAVLQVNYNKAIAMLRDANENTPLKNAIEFAGKNVPESTVNAILEMTKSIATLATATGNPHAQEIKTLTTELNNFVASVTDGKEN